MRTVIYARYSSSNQTELSIQGQLDVCNKYAEANELTVVDTFIDRAVSGRTAKRPAFMEMMKQSEEQAFEIVLVYQLDRFSRSRLDSGLYKAHLRENGARVVSANERISDDASGILMEGLLESMAEYYSYELAQKVRRGLRLNAEKGLYTGANVAPGYIIKDKQFVIDKRLAPVIQRIYDMYLANAGIATIVRALAADSIKTRAGKLFNKSSVRRVLTNPRYTGLYQYGAVELENAVPRIISDETFAKAQALLKRGVKTIDETTN